MQTLWIYVKRNRPELCREKQHELTNGDRDLPMFPSPVRMSFARSAWYEAEDSPETSAYCLTIRRINTEMYKSLTAVLLRFKSSRLALFDLQDQGTTILRNLRSYLTIDKAKHPRKFESLCVIIFTFQPIYI